MVVTDFTALQIYSAIANPMFRHKPRLNHAGIFWNEVSYYYRSAALEISSFKTLQVLICHKVIMQRFKDLRGYLFNCAQDNLDHSAA